MKFGEGDILKRKVPAKDHTDIGVVVEADAWEGTLEVLLFDQDGPYTRRFDENHAENLFEIDHEQ
jgi:hypothetical protein